MTWEIGFWKTSEWVCPGCGNTIGTRGHPYCTKCGLDIDKYIDARTHPEPEKRQFKSGTTSTKKPRMELIPYEGLVRAAKRYELGLEIHGDVAYNALKSYDLDSDPLLDVDWLIERASHGISHLYRLIDQLKTGDYRGDDNAGAVAWCGLTLSAAVTKLESIGDGKSNANETISTSTNTEESAKRSAIAAMAKDREEKKRS